MLHHISFPTADLARAAAFYDAALGALGFRRVVDVPTAVGYGLEDGKDRFLLKLRAEEVRPLDGGFHLAFAATQRAQVDAFHAAALAHGGVDEGAPGVRSHYGPHYYAAFVRDPDGHRLEAVRNTPESGLELGAGLEVEHPRRDPVARHGRAPE